MHSNSAGRWPAHVQRDQPQPIAAPVTTPAIHDEALEFVRFCYRRRRVAWPDLYDEMCLVAARSAFRGLGYADLVDHGISFCLTELHRLAELTERVMAEDRLTTESNVVQVVPIMLAAQPAGG